MNTRRQVLVSAGIVGAAAAVVGLYALLGSSGDGGTAGTGGHNHGAIAATGEVRPVALGADAARRIGVTYATAEYRAVDRAIQTVGSVTWDETRQTVVNPKIEGWIERLYVDFTGAPVRRGQPLMEVYSPMLVAAQEELILAGRLADETAAAGGPAAESARELLEAARRRLRFVDVSAGDVARIERSGAVRRTLTLHAPASGVVVEKAATAGMRVMPGMDLFRIADLSRVWIDGQVFEKDMAAVRVGQHARVTFEAFPGEVFDAVVSYVYPSVELDSRTGRVRLALSNPGGRLKPGMYARVELDVGNGAPALLIPRSAVHTTGERSLVFVRGADGTLAHREVTLGRFSGTDVEVLSGLRAGEVVVASANFLIDAESSMGRAMGSMSGMEMDGGAPEVAAQAPPTPATPSSAPAPSEADPHAGHAPAPDPHARHRME